MIRLYEIFGGTVFLCGCKGLYGGARIFSILNAGIGLGRIIAFSSFEEASKALPERHLELLLLEDAK